jgi:uncharacterized protein YgiM (DUF1202 family)
MTIGTAVLLWLALAAVTGALFSLVPRGYAERWLFGAGLLLAALLLLVAVALPAPAPPTVATSANVPGLSLASTTTAETPPPPTTAPATRVPTASTPQPTATQTPAIAPPPPTGATVPAEASTATPDDAPTATPDVVTVTSGTVNVRSAPAFGNNVIGQVIAGDELVVIDSAEGWLRVRLGSVVSPLSSITNGEGWISSELVTR